MNIFNKHLTSENETLAISRKLAAFISEGVVIYLHGPLGAGKTTFVRGFLRGMGFEGKVKSPTYTLVEEYEINHKKIFHFDLYRLLSANELEQIGIQEYFSQSSICLIEWPEKGFPLLPAPDLTCYIEFMDTGRNIRFEAYSARGEEIVNALR